MTLKPGRRQSAVGVWGANPGVAAIGPAIPVRGAVFDTAQIPGHTADIRRALLLVGAAALLGGCASRPSRSGGTASSGGRRAPATPAPATQPPLELDPLGRESAVASAMLVVNTPYTYGGNTPEGGFDCSGLVHYVFSHLSAGTAAARRLPRSTAQWAAATVPVDEARLQRGDLVFFNTTGRAFSHMGIYVGQDQFVHAPSTGGTVRKESVNGRYFGPRYLGARRAFAMG